MVNLPQKLTLWASFAGLSKAQKKALENLVSTEQEKISLHEWLLRLERSRDFKYAQRLLAEKACQMLLTLQDATWKELFFVQMENNLEACEDRGSMAFNEIYTAWVLHTMPVNAPLREKLELLTGVAKTLALRKELAKLIGNEAESVEIYLYYEIQMKKRLQLVTAIEQMAHSTIGRRDNINENELAQAVQEGYSSELIEIPAFQMVVKDDSDYQARLEPKENELGDRQNALDDRAKEMNSAEYNAKCLQLKNEHKQMRIRMAKTWLEEKLRS